MSSVNDQRDMEKLLNRFYRLRKKTAGAIKTRDRMSYHTYVDYKTKYVMEIGAFEYEFLKVENNLLKMRRKIEIIHGLMDKNEKVDISLIEHMVDREFEENELKLKSMEQDIEIAKILESDKRLSPKDERDLDRIYEEMILELHPDINLEISSDQGLDWEKIVWTYETYDLVTMRYLKDVLEAGSPSYVLKEEGSYRLEDRVEALEATFRKVESEIQEMNSNFPFDMIELLKDEEWVDDKRKELLENTEIYKEVEEELGNYILKILPQNAVFSN